MRFLIALSALFFCSFKANAIVFIEPMLGYATGTYTATLELSGVEEKLSTKIKGMSFGGRGGLSWRGLQLGADYTKNDLKMTEEEDLDDNTFDTSEWGAFLGYKFYFLRIYGSYIFNAKIKESDFDSGKGYKFGLTFYALRHLALSLEVRKVQFDKVTDEYGDAARGEYNLAAVLLSFPFEI